MKDIVSKFELLGCKNAPGQEKLKKNEAIELRGEKLDGDFVDFSHGDVDAHPPIPGSREKLIESFERGAESAYTEYRGNAQTREELAKRVSKFLNSHIDYKTQMILTPGTQGALFLAFGANVMPGDKVVIAAPDYFANRKLANFFAAEELSVRLHYEDAKGSGIDLEKLEEYFKTAKLFIFSNPNNPTGAIYSKEELKKIVELAKKYDVTIIADELYSRQVYEKEFVHMAEVSEGYKKLITILGPSKTESMSGFRLGLAIADEEIIDRMEKLQAIVSLRAAGYNQALMDLWFDEEENWLKNRIDAHRRIRDELFEIFESAGLKVRLTDAGSYLFLKIPNLKISIEDFVDVLRLQANVIVTCGTEFGEEFTDCVRLNFSQDRIKARDAAMRIVEIARRYGC